MEINAGGEARFGEQLHRKPRLVSLQRHQKEEPDRNARARDDRLKVLLVNEEKFSRYRLSEALCTFSNDISAVFISKACKVTRKYLNANLCLLCVDGGSNAGFAADLSHLASTLPHAYMIVVAETLATIDVVGALEQGVRGYLHSDLDLPTMVEALRMVARGGLFVLTESLLLGEEVRRPSRRAVCCAPASSVVRTSSTEDRLENITRCERGVLSRVQEGKPNKIIAYELKISEYTVKTHIQSLLRKLGATNRTQLSFLTRSVVGETLTRSNNARAALS